MAKKVIRLNESEFKNLIKRVINEMGYGSDDFDTDSYADDDEWDDPAFNIPDNIGDVTGGNEYHGENDREEFASEETPEDTDINNDPNRDVNPDDVEPGEGEMPVTDPADSMDEPEEPSGITPLSTMDTEPEEQHQEGDVIYFENTPIEFKDGRYHMTIEDGFDMGNAKCPKITVVGSNLKAVEKEYEYLWDNFYYKDHGNYAKEMLEKGLAEYDFGNMMVGDGSQVNLEDMPVIVDLDKK